MKKMCKVVMLPTEKTINCIVIQYFRNKEKYLQYFDSEVLREYPFEGYTEYEAECLVPQHLYIISNDEIKEGIFYLNLISNEILKSDFDINYEQNHYKKIIASTDKSLNLPLISEGFIKKYVELQGKIDKVMVEFEEISVFPGYVEGEGFPKSYRENQLKLRKDNTIIISKVKNEFSKREVINILTKAIGIAIVYPEDFCTGIIFDKNKTMDWIENEINNI